MADSKVIESEPGIQKDSIGKKGAFSCWHCSYSSDWRNNLRTHIVRVHKTSIGMYECCGIKFPDKKAFEHHTVGCHPRRYICKSCDRGFFQASNLKRHMNIESCYEKLTSSTSDHATPRKDNWDQNIQFGEDENEDSSSRSEAPVDTIQQDRSSLDVDLRETFACTNCPFETKWRHSLKRHRSKARHKTNPEFSVINIFGKRGYRKDAATIHRHRFMCSTCSQVFRNSSLLRSHHLARPSHKPFKCDLCDYAAVRLWDLKSHKKRSHKDDNPPIVLLDQSILPSRYPTEDTHLNEDVEVPRVPLLRSSRSRFAGRETREPEHREMVKDGTVRYDIKYEIMEQCSLSQQSFSEAPSYPLIDSADGGTNESSPQTLLVLTESKPLSNEVKNKKGAIQEARKFSCTLCPYSTKWRSALKRHIKVHEREGIISLMTRDSPLTVQHVSSSSESVHLSHPPSDGLRRSGRLTVKPAASLLSENSLQKMLPLPLSAIDSIHDEARQLKSRMSLVETVPSLLPLFLRLLELSAYTMSQIRAALEVEVCSQATECFEYVWNTSKLAIIRWEQLKGEMNHDTSLNAVQYVYGTLPVFANWGKNEHLDMLANVILLSLNTVKNWK